MRKSGLAYAIILAWGSVFAVHGDNPNEYKAGDRIELQVAPLTSIQTQVSRDYYSLPFCRPSSGGIRTNEKSLSDLLTGRTIHNSAFNIQAMKDVYCQKVCQVILSEKESGDLSEHIRKGYHHNWLLDDLPSAYSFRGHNVRFSGGFPIGSFVRLQSTKVTTYVNNHVNIYVYYRRAASNNELVRVVQFRVEPVSVSHEFSGMYPWDGKSTTGFNMPLSTCPGQRRHFAADQVARHQVVSNNATIIFTYDVIWRPSHVAWSSRWSVYSRDNSIPYRFHWLFVTNSLVVVVCLGITVTSILVCNLKHDIASETSRDATADAESCNNAETKLAGWRALDGDVFRPPRTLPLLYAVMVGSGMHLLATLVSGLLVIILQGLSTNAHLVVAFLSCYCACGGVGGYWSHYIHRLLRGTSDQLCAFLTATCFPGLAFLVHSVNVVTASCTVPKSDSDAGVLVMVQVLILCAWWCGLVPSVLIGSWLAHLTTTARFPSDVSPKERPIPRHGRTVCRAIVLVLLGLFGFSGLYFQFYCLLGRLWVNRPLHVFGIVLVSLVMTALTCGLGSIVHVYCLLRDGNHRWWWDAFHVAAGTGVYAGLYSLRWFLLRFGAVPSPTALIIYGSTMLIVSLGLCLITGAVGTLAALWYVRTIYSKSAKGT